MAAEPVHCAGAVARIRALADEAAKAARAGAPAAAVAASLARAPALIVRLKQVEREFAVRASVADADMLARKRRLDDVASGAQELHAERSQLQHELSLCDAASRAPALDDGELVDVPAPETGGLVPDEKQLRLRRRAAELRTRRELHAQIGALREAVTAARARRARLLDADAAVRPELVKLIGAASSLEAYLSVPSVLCAAEPADPRAHLLPPPLWSLYTEGALLVGTPALGSTLYSVSIATSTPPVAGAMPTPHVAAAPAAPCDEPPDARAPLSVRLHVLCARRRLFIEFSYFPRLHVLGAAAPEGGAELLRAVNVDDDGHTFPHGRALLAASRGSPVLSPEALAPAVPFRWAQWLGGIATDSPLPSGGCAEAAARLSLAEVLQAIASAS
ncbi:hypothetical protein KFE25_005465 [Diacronema lutheri]|uniref:Uncharacterized protein n=2 Tax=Diacronema lutheri TaxID=2081491 RepID=A0A8J5XUY8_DIALT|nr:hypothetical protein KFE25_005465 [Diacronema lutheri]